MYLKIMHSFTFIILCSSQTSTHIFTYICPYKRKDLPYESQKCNSRTATNSLFGNFFFFKENDWSDKEHFKNCVQKKL